MNMHKNKADNEVGKGPYIWIGSLLAVLLILTLTVYSVWGDDNKYGWVPNALSVLGTLVSLSGLILALYQIAQANLKLKNMRSITDATKTAVDENRSEIRNLLSYSDVVRISDKLQIVQEHLSKNQIPLALHITREIKDGVIGLKSRVERNFPESTDSLDKIIRDLGVDIQTLNDHLIDKKRRSSKEEQKSTLNCKAICKNMESAREEIIIIENKFRNNQI